MKRRVVVNLLFAAFALISLAVLSWLCLPRLFVSERVLLFYYPPMLDARTNDESRTCAEGRADGVVDAMFHMRSALAFVWKEPSRSKIVAEFMRRHPEYRDAEEAVEKAFREIRTEMIAGPLPRLKIISESTSAEMSKEVAECYEKVIVDYFKTESRGLLEKMTAWFESQKVGKSPEAVKEVERQKNDAIRNAEAQNLMVISTTNCHDRMAGKRFL